MHGPPFFFLLTLQPPVYDFSLSQVQFFRQLTYPRRDADAPNETPVRDTPLEFLLYNYLQPGRSHAGATSPLASATAAALGTSGSSRCPVHDQHDTMPEASAPGRGKGGSRRAASGRRPPPSDPLAHTCQRRLRPGASGVVVPCLTGSFSFARSDMKACAFARRLKMLSMSIEPWG